MLDPVTLLIVAGTFLIAGSVKGVIGLGLPTVSLAFLTVALDLPTAMALQQASFLTAEHGAILAAAVIPALAGMILGQRIRDRLSEQKFRKVFFVSLLVLGVYIVTNAVRVFYQSSIPLE